MASRYLTRQQAQDRLGVCRNTIKRYIQEGIVDAERLPAPSGLGPWRISEESVDNLLEGTLRQQALADEKALGLRQ